MIAQMRGDSLADKSACEVVVVGGGAVGLAAAVGLARRGVATCLVAAPTVPRPGRTVALLDGSVRFLDSCGLWDAVRPSAAPLRVMRIVDATGSLFRSVPVAFDSADIGLPAFGFNVENHILEACLGEAARNTPYLTLIDNSAVAIDYGAGHVAVTTQSGQTVAARLVVGADGRRSLARKSALIGVQTHDYPQTALTAVFGHSEPHHDVSTEFHTREGPFTLVPLPGVEGTAHRSSLVWVMRPDEAERRRRLPLSALAAEAERQAARLLGSMTAEGPVGMFPIATSISRRLTGHRLALIGEAAHALPPIGAQGLNLSLRDADDLCNTLSSARRAGRDLGAPATLDRYAAARRGDVAARVTGVDLLNGSLLSRSPAVDLARGAGLTALAAIGPLRRLVMRHGLVPQSRPRERA